MSQVRTPLGRVDPDLIRRKKPSKIQRTKICTAAEFGHDSGEIATEPEIPVSIGNPNLEGADPRPDNSSKPRCGRLKSYNERDQRTILRLARRNPKITYDQLKRQTELSLSIKTF